MHDARGRLIETILPDESVLTTGYDRDNNRTASTGVDGKTTRSFYDVRGRLIRTVDGLLRETTFEYDAANQMTAQVDANGVRSEYAYDDLGRRIAVTTAAGTAEAITTRTEYDKVGNVVAQIDGLGQRSEYVYDDRNRRKAVIDAADEPGITRFSYDAVGNLLSLTDSADNTTSYLYDERNRLTTETNELEKTRSFEYDKNGNRTQVTDRNGRITDYIYDNLNRQTHERWLDENGQVVNEIVTTYDAADQVTAVSDAHSAYTFTYDALGYQDRVGNTGFGGIPQVVLDYDYDSEGKLESVTEIIEGVEGATTSYDYDERDQVTSITQSGNGTSDKRVEFDYSPTGQFEDIRRYSDVDGTQLVASTDYDYDEHNRLESLTHSNQTNETLASYDFTYDAAHRIDTITDVDGTTDYGYDQTNQLIGADHSDINKPDESYDYDQNGNRTDSHLHGGDYVTGENNQLNSDGIYTYTYDDQGNMKTQTAIATGIVEEFEWDYRNRLTAIITRDVRGAIAHQVNYVYDVMGRRIAKTIDADGDGSEEATTTHFIYDGNNVLMEFVDDSTTPSQRYLHGPQVDQVLAQDNSTGQPQWLLADHLGTVHDVVDNSGTILNHIIFDSFGNVLNQTDDTFSTRYLFTGREFDAETGLYYYRARYYNPEVGQFITQDPIGFDGGNNNLYGYVSNNPIDAIDPFGKSDMRAPWNGAVVNNSNQTVYVHISNNNGTGGFAFLEPGDATPNHFACSLDPDGLWVQQNNGDWLYYPITWPYFNQATHHVDENLNVTRGGQLVEPWDGQPNSGQNNYRGPDGRGQTDPSPPDPSQGYPDGSQWVPVRPIDANRNGGWYRNLLERFFSGNNNDEDCHCIYRDNWEEFGENRPTYHLPF